ncbi:caspace recruitment domain-containing protein [Pompano iridovirus]|uniref:Caspace recruitment domain-containing protein n=1 Tax=Pompano iridovirus TaxID=2494350 RepID=A0A3S9LM80_ISKNV|nr:caspace recruitment domain-containing protein [Pompano iridovirus]AZQ20993.1 caspace recruitment domain-containing protein [Pompano iridovirus]
MWCTVCPVWSVTFVWTTRLYRRLRWLSVPKTTYSTGRTCFPPKVCTITLVISSNNNGLYNMCFCLSDYESALRTLRMSFLTEFADRHTLMLLMDGLVDVRTLMPDMMAAIKCDTNIRDWARKLIDNACRQGNKVSKVFVGPCNRHVLLVSNMPL